MKKLIGALLAVSMLGCGAGALAEAAQPDPVVEMISGIEDADARIEALMNMRVRIDELLAELSGGKYKDLDRNMKGDEVKALQERLAELGYYTVKINGKYDNETVKAVKQFEKGNGMENDGKASAFDQIIIFSTEAIDSEGNRAGGAVDVPGASVSTEPATEPAASDTGESVETEPAFDATGYEELDYSEYAAAPQDYLERKLVAKGTVAQTMEGSIRLSVGEGQVLFVNLGEVDGTGLAIGDVVTVYGELNGEFTYKSISGKEIALPSALAHGIEKAE